MPNVNDLQKFIKADNVEEGDYIHFCDAGRIYEKEFEDKDTKEKKVQDVLEMEVIVNEDMKRKIYSPNTVSRTLLKEAWGPDTENWVGKVGVVTFADQMSFGKLIKLLVVKPYVEPKPKREPRPVVAPAASKGSPANIHMGGNEAEAQARMAAGQDPNVDPVKEMQWRD